MSTLAHLLGHLPHRRARSGFAYWRARWRARRWAIHHRRRGAPVYAFDRAPFYPGGGGLGAIFPSAEGFGRPLRRIDRHRVRRLPDIELRCI